MLTLKNMAAAMISLAGISASANAATTATIGTWAKDTAYAGTGTSLTGSGSSATWTQPTGSGNAAIVAPFSSLTTSIGDTITFTGNVAFASTVGNLGNVQFRFGLFNTATPATSTSYKGYMAEVPQGGGGAIQADLANGTGNWAAGGGGTFLTALTNTNNGTNTAPNGGAAGPFTFKLAITQTGVGAQAIAASFISADGTTYVWNETATDATTVAAANSTYNEFGFFEPGSLGTITFSNVSVSVPEPTTLSAAALGGIGLLSRRRRA